MSDCEHKMSKNCTTSTAPMDTVCLEDLLKLMKEMKPFVETDRVLTLIKDAQKHGVALSFEKASWIIKESDKFMAKSFKIGVEVPINKEEFRHNFRSNYGWKGPVIDAKCLFRVGS